MGCELWNSWRNGSDFPLCASGTPIGMQVKKMISRTLASLLFLKNGLDLLHNSFNKWFQCILTRIAFPLSELLSRQEGLRSQQRVLVTFFEEFYVTYWSHSGDAGFFWGLETRSTGGRHSMPSGNCGNMSSMLTCHVVLVNWWMVTVNRTSHFGSLEQETSVILGLYHLLWCSSVC
jgi:hypothetical protein